MSRSQTNIRVSGEEADQPLEGGHRRVWKAFYVEVVQEDSSPQSAWMLFQKHKREGLIRERPINSSTKLQKGYHAG